MSSVLSADALAPELMRLWSDHNQHDQAGLTLAKSSVYEKIKATERVATFADVEGPAGALLLLCLIDDTGAELESLVPDGKNADRAEAARDAISRMAYTVCRWLERTHGVDRLDAAGGIYLPVRCDPSAPHLTDKPEVA